jgi:hypothetical protein
VITCPDLWSDAICGRMGNQLFVIATAYAHALDNDQDLAIPECNIGKLIAGSARLKIMSREALPVATTTHKEPHYNYDPLPRVHNPNVLALHGFFQSYRYFHHHRQAILDLFYPGDAIYEDARRSMRELGSNLVALCVRRGDYVQKSDFHTVQPMSYYDNAVARFRGCQFAVVSDDIPWCKENLRYPNLSFVTEHDSWKKLWMMSFCDHHIIANSSYHWWGAYLNRKPDKKSFWQGGFLNRKADKRVVAPRQWFGPAAGQLQERSLKMAPPAWPRI